MSETPTALLPRGGAPSPACEKETAARCYWAVAYIEMDAGVVSLRPDTALAPDGFDNCTALGGCADSDMANRLVGGGVNAGPMGTGLNDLLPVELLVMLLVGRDQHGHLVVDPSNRFLLRLVCFAWNEIITDVRHTFDARHWFPHSRIRGHRRIECVVSTGAICRVFARCLSRDDDFAIRANALARVCPTERVQVLTAGLAVCGASKVHAAIDLLAPPPPPDNLDIAAMSSQGACDDPATADGAQNALLDAAVRWGLVDVVDTLVSRSVTTKYESDSSSTLLRHAIREATLHGHCLVFGRLLDRMEQWFPQECTDTYGESLWNGACEADHASIIHHLFERVHEHSGDCRCPLARALEYRHKTRHLMGEATAWGRVDLVAAYNKRWSWSFANFMAVRAASHGHTTLALWMLDHIILVRDNVDDRGSDDVFVQDTMSDISYHVVMYAPGKADAILGKLVQRGWSSDGFEFECAWNEIMRTLAESRPAGSRYRASFALTVMMRWWPVALVQHLSHLKDAEALIQHLCLDDVDALVEFPFL